MFASVVFITSDSVMIKCITAVVYLYSSSGLAVTK